MRNEEVLAPFTEGRWNICENRSSQIPIGYLFDGVGFPVQPGSAAYKLDGGNLIDPTGKELGELKPFCSCWAIYSGAFDDTVGIVLRPVKG